MKIPIYGVFLVTIIFVQEKCLGSTQKQTHPAQRARRAAENGATNANVEQTYALLEEGEKVIQASNDSDVILVVGNTGAGKSTISMFLTGANLEAYKATKTKLLIRDVNPIPKISTSTIVSKTIFPELFIDPVSGRSFFDCPGFSDTRNSTIEIVNSFFVKKIAEGAARVKILLVITYNSLDAGENRIDFRRLIRHATTLLKNMDVFLPSISLVATKVSVHDYEDDDILESMSEFIAQAREDLGDTVSVETQKLLDVLLAQDAEGNPARLTFFRQPRRAGFLSADPIMQRRKTHMEKIIFDNTEFVTASKDDYGFTLSAQAIHDVAILTNTIESSITGIFRGLSAQLSLIYNINPVSQSFSGPYSQGAVDLNAVKEKMNSISSFFNHLQVLDSNLTMDFVPTNTSPAIFQSANAFLSDIISHLKFEGNDSASASARVDSLLKTIETNAKYLEFIESFSAHAIRASLPFKSWLEPLVAFKTTTENQLGTLASTMSDDILRIFTGAAAGLGQYFGSYSSKMEDLQPLEFKSKLETLLSWYSRAKKSSNSPAQAPTQNLLEFIENFLQLINSVEGDAYEIVDMSSQRELVAKAEFLSFYRHAQDSGSVEVQRGFQPSSQDLEYKTKWLSPFKTSLTDHSNFKNVETLIEKNIEVSMGGIKETLASFYSSEFQSSDGGIIQNLQERLQGDLIWFKKELRVGVETENLEGAVGLENTRKFLEPVLNRTENKGAADSAFGTRLESLGLALSCIDLLQSHTDTSLAHNQLKWARNLQDFVDVLDRVIDEAVSCSSFTSTSEDVGPPRNVTVARGTFVSLRQAVASCWTGQSSTENNRELLIFSKHSIFIDESLKINSIDLSIIAPNWVISSDSEINVDGQDNDHLMEKASGIRERGRPGFPGGNAGNFLGVGKHFVGAGGSLSVSARGGRGSRGQEGGNGRDGNNDAPIDLSRISYSFSPPTWWGPPMPHPFKREAYIAINITQCPYTYRQSSRKLCRVDHEDVTDIEYWCRGYLMRSVQTEGGEGNEGGEGGKGGLGGQGGLINILRPSLSIDNSNSSHTQSSNAPVLVNTHNSSGPRGFGGAGGRGGFGGQWFRALVQIDPDNVEGKGRIHFRYNHKNYYNNGKEGRGNVNEENIMQPHKREPSMDTIRSNQETHKNMYVNFAGDHVQDKLVGSSLSEFLSLLQQQD